MFQLTQEVRADTEEKRSQFLAHLMPFANFDARLAELRATHPKAAHHVTAFRRLDDQDRIEEGAKDDGEPGGTSGMPSLRCLMGADLINVGLVTVRYFGGTKLGTGGLARAYAAAANAAIHEARQQGLLVPWQRLVERDLSASFAQSAELEQEIARQGWQVLDRVFHTNGVTIRVLGPESELS